MKKIKKLSWATLLLMVIIIIVAAVGGGKDLMVGLLFIFFALNAYYENTVFDRIHTLEEETKNLKIEINELKG